MKKLITVFTLALILMAGCKKSQLQIYNPNSPTPASALTTQGGLEEFALGLWTKTNTGGNLLMYSLVIHSIMGDEQYAPVGNYGWRYANQVNTITLPAAAPYNGIVVPNVFGVTQQVQLKSLNNLVSAVANASDVLIYEWNLGYLVNGEANQLLTAIGTNTVVSANEKTVMQAFAYFWKGLCYSRLGSMYLSGVINNNTDGTTNGNYVAHDALITEANADFDKAIALLTPLSATDATYTSTMKVINPAFCIFPTNAPMMIREMYTYEARNYLVNHKVATMTATDWATVKALATKGLIAGDVAFAEGMDPAGTSDLSGTQGHVFEWDNFVGNPGWTYMSERFVQDFKPGDARFTKGAALIGSAGYTGAADVNHQSRGIQFGTRYVAALIEKGGYWATNTHQGAVQFAGSYDENALMLAEANIRTGSIDAGLAFVDQVRSANGAGLTAVANTGLSLTNALEELRKERRIALYLRGLAFYDARRWGVTAPASAGGGRANANVLVPNSIFQSANSSGSTLVPCFIDYNYMDYWDVPATEFSYNMPVAGSAAIAN
jgi:hypothetical protein